VNVLMSWFAAHWDTILTVLGSWCLVSVMFCLALGRIARRLQGRNVSTSRTKPPAVAAQRRSHSRPSQPVSRSFESMDGARPV